MSKFNFNGEIVSKEFDKMNSEDVCVADFQTFIDGLQDGEPIELYFSSLGGDVLAGQQMVSILKDAERNGHSTTANVTSIAASMASVVACACQTLKLYEGAYLMVHLPWTMAVGNSNDLQKEISTLNQLKNGMVKIYRTKFDLSDEEIDAMLSAETWIDSDNYKDWKLNCEIVENGEPLKIAASIGDKHFKNIPTRIMEMKNKAEEVLEETEKKEEPVEEVETETTPDVKEPEEEKKEPEEEKAEDEKPVETEEPVEEEDIEELRRTIEILKEENESLKSQLAECQKEEKAEETTEEEKTPEDGEVLNKAQVQARISGIQSSMQKQINDFKSQLKVKEEELIKAKADVTRLNDSLEKTTRELSEMTSALEEKQTALDKLNANVNHAPEEIPTMNDGLAKCATPAEKVAFLKSGKYVH